MIYTEMVDKYCALNDMPLENPEAVQKGQICINVCKLGCDKLDRCRCLNILDLKMITFAQHSSAPLRSTDVWTFVMEFVRDLNYS